MGVGMEYGPAACEWIRQGNAIRLVWGTKEPEMTILPEGDAVAIICPSWDAEKTEQAYETLLGRLWMARYGNAEARDQMRAWVRSRSAA